MKIVISTLGSYGDIHPYLPLAKGLIARGHKAVILTSPKYRGDIIRQGIEFAPMRPDKDLSPEDFRKIMDDRNGSEHVIRNYVMPHLRDAYDDLSAAAAGADLLLSHVITYAVPVFAEKTGIPWMSTALAPMIFFSAYDPPVLAPAPWLSGLRRFGPKVNGPLFKFLRKISHSWSEPVRALRRDLGMPEGKDPLFEGQHSPYGVLCHFSKVFADPQPDWPEKTQICGFMFHDEDIGGQGVDPRLQEFLSEGPSPVCFTLGSSAVHIADDFYHIAQDACRNLGRRAVLVAGDMADKMDLDPRQAVAVKTAPYHWLFPKCSGIVHQGGIGTTAQALRSGRPEIVMPFAHDQYDNADRIKRIGAGTVLRKKHLSISTLSRALEEILGDKDILGNAEKIGQTVRSEDGVKNACDAIEAAYHRSSI